MNRSRDKGLRFERETANQLTRTTGKTWMRTPHSGAYGTTNSITQQMGDVCTTDPRLSNIHIECKHYSVLTLNDIFSTKSKLWKWVLKAETLSEKWYLFVKADRTGTYVITKNSLERLNLTGKTLTIGIYTITKIR